MKVGHPKDLLTAKFWLHVLALTNLAGWGFFIIAAIVFHYARPEPDTILTEFFGISVREYWQITLSDLFVGSMFMGFLLSVISIGLNILLYKESRHHLWLNLWILIFASGGALVYYSMTSLA